MNENESEAQLMSDLPLSTSATQNEGVTEEGDAALKQKVAQKTQEEKFQETMAQQQTLMTQQQVMIDNLLRALERTATQTSSSTVSRIDFKLVQYDPDDSPYSMSEWLDLATKSKIRYNMSDEEMIMKVGEALQKRGAKHFRQWKPRVRDWQNLVNDLTCSFPVVGTPFSRLSAVTTTRSSDCESLAAFCNRKLREIRAIYEVEFPWSFILGIIEGCCDDNELRVTIRLHQPSTEPSLIILAGERDNDVQRSQKEIRSRPEKHVRPSRYEPYARDNYNRKANKFMGTCHSCNQLGHKSYECRSKSIIVSTPKPQVQDGRGKESSNACSHCKKFGHTADKCYFKVGFPKKTRETSDQSKKILLVKGGRSLSRIPIATAISERQRSFKYILDTGAEISLVHESVARQLSSTITLKEQFIQGVGTKLTRSIGTCSMIVVMPQLTAEIEFTVVPDHTIPDIDALIGWDVIKRDGLKLVKTTSGLELQYDLASVCHLKQCNNLNVSGLDEAVIRKIQQLLEAAKTDMPPCVTTGQLTIKLKDSTPVAYRPRPLAYAERVKLKIIIQEQLDEGIIQESSSEYASPIVLVKKKSGDLRLCVDYRDLNKKVAKDRYPLPRIQDQIDALSTAKFYCTLDMKSGFHQLEVDVASRHLLAFVTPDGHYEYRRMPFGFVNSPACFQKAIDKALGKLKDTIAYVYLDDILVPSQTISEGLQKLETVIMVLSKAGFTLNLEKCHFFKTSTEYLGVVIENGTIKPNPRKVEALRNSAPPTDVRGVRQFMGLAGYFRKFIRGFSVKTAPITTLLRKGTTFHWTKECEEIRQEIIALLTSSPILQIFDPSLEVELHTDASSVGLGGILMQKTKENVVRPVAYFSRRTTECESRYHSYDLETLAIVAATEHFRVYLYGREFTVFTDCNSVRATALKKELQPRVARWWIKLQDFDFDIEYRPGAKMAHVDYLSRNMTEPDKPKVFLAKKLNMTEGKTIREYQAEDEFCQSVNNGVVYNPEYTICDGLVKFNNKCYVPQALRLMIMKKYHDDSSHPGYEKVLHAMRDDIAWKGMAKTVKKYVQNCRNCVQGKSHTGKRSGLCQLQDKPETKMDTWHIDHAGPLVKSEGKTQILVIIDSFTKYVKFCAISKKTCEDTIKALDKVFEELGKPRRIIADRGLAFQATLFKDFLRQHDVELHLIATGLPRGNGQVERVMRTLFNMMRSTLNNRDEKFWIRELPNIERDQNDLVHKTTGKSPYELMFGRKRRLAAVQDILRDVPVTEANTDTTKDVKDRMRKFQNKTIEQFNKIRTSSKPFYEKDQVVMEDTQCGGGKLKPRYKGPFEVLKCLPNERYALRRINGQNRVTVAGQEQLRPWPQDQAQTDII